jgi:hypothetical protein
VHAVLRAVGRKTRFIPPGGVKSTMAARPPGFSAAMIARLIDTGSVK